MNSASNPQAFLASELAAWPMAAENFARIRQSAADGCLVTLNPDSDGWKTSKLFANHRRASITARTDAKSVASRPCFLCAANRPAEQSAVRWRDYEILVNPFPLSACHFTIASARHEPQAITAGRIADMAALTREMRDMCVFYNGPRCGASAPDHFHFQAVGRDAGENIFRDSISGDRICRKDGAALYRSGMEAAPYPFFIIESTDDKGLQEMFMKVTDALTDITPGEAEPMMNIAMCALPGCDTIRTVIIPRGKHRPECYTDAEAPLLVSPATIEMLGTIVCSRKEDFDRVDSATADSILSEVGLSESAFNNIVNRLKTDSHDS